MKIRMIQREEVPCWFELSWQSEEPSLLLRIHSLLVPTLTVHPLVAEGYQKEFSFQSFAGLVPGTTAFGFNNALQNQGEHDGFLVLKAVLPRIRIEGTKKCQMCRGAGKDEWLKEVCTSCGGNGKDPIFSWEKAHAVCATLSILLQQLKYPHHDADTPVSFPQLLVVSTIAKAGMHGHSLHGTYSRILCEWMRKLDPHAGIPEMNQAMREAYYHLMGKPVGLEREFQTSLSNGNGWLNVKCPGQACTLNPHISSDVKPGIGYEFSSHNVDGPPAQLTLLAGLAALHDKARRELNSAS